jgi:hypothetical protein
VLVREERREKESKSEIIKSEIELVHATNHLTAVTTTINLTAITTTTNTSPPSPPPPTITAVTTTITTIITTPCTITPYFPLVNAATKPVILVVFSLREHIHPTVK